MDKRSQLALAIFWGIVFLGICLWLFWRNKTRLKPSFIVRHALFNLFVYAGCLWLDYEDVITAFIFGKPVYKGSPEEFPAGLVILGGILFNFFIATMALGKNRVAEFKLYFEAFGLKWFK